MRIKRTILAILSIILLTGSYIRAAVISDNDGSAFITKAEFETLKKDFNSQITRYNESIDNKIDGAIAAYLAAFNKQKENIDSILNRFSSSQRTFVQAITNPTTCTQDDIYIEESGYWVAAFPRGSAGNQYCGYALAGLVGYDGGHQKRLWPKNNGKTSKYIFLDTTKVNNIDYLYINDNYRKYIQYYIYISGARTADSSPWTAAQTFGGPTSISWTNTYNWSGSNDRVVTNEGTTVNCTEVLMLQVKNDDYDTTTTGVNEMAWASSMSGSTIYTTNAGCLKKNDRLNWSHRITDFSLGISQQQVRNMLWWGNNDLTNSYNNTTAGTANPVPLSFNVPKITMLGGDKIIVNDVSRTIGEPVYYYSGLPLCTLPSESKNITIKIKPTINKKSAGDTSGITLAIKKDKFNNTNIASESNNDIYYRKTWSTTELPSEITIELDEDDLASSRGKNIWIKANASNANCTVTLETKEIVAY